MTPRSDRASWWCSVTTLGHTHFSVASTDPRSSRRSLLRALVSKSVALGLNRDAHAQNLLKDIQRAVDALSRVHQVVGAE